MKILEILRRKIQSANISRFSYSNTYWEYIFLENGFLEEKEEKKENK